MSCLLSTTGRCILYMYCVLVQTVQVLAHHSLHGIRWLIPNRNETQPMSNVLVVQDGRVLVKLYQINRQGGDFGNHDTPQCVGNTGVGFAQDELDFMGCHVQDLNFGETLMRHFQKESFVEDQELTTRWAMMDYLKVWTLGVLPTVNKMPICRYQSGTGCRLPVAGTVRTERPPLSP